jgi:hypothetical protein
MPVDFLTDEQAQHYGHYTGEPTLAQLARYFYLDDAARSFISIRRGDHNRLGFALQLCTVRFLGTFLADPTDVPEGVVKHLTVQLNIGDLGCLSRYRERPATHREHAGEIQLRHGYHDFTDQPEHLRLIRWLYTRAWLSAERPIVLFDLATARLVERKILLPGVSLLTRLVARVRDRAAARLWRSLAQLPTGKQQKRLEALLVTPEASLSPLDRLRRAPTRISSPAMVGALERLTEIRSLEGSTFNLSRIPPGHVKALARYAAAARAQAIERMPEQRRIATLVAYAQVFEAVAQDDALDLLNQLITQYLARAKEDGKNERLRTIQELDAAALRMRDVCKIVLDSRCSDHKVRSRIFAQIARLQLEEDVDTVSILSRTGDDTNNYYDHLVNNYGTIRRFLPALLRGIEFEGTAAGEPVLQAFHFLKTIEGEPHPTMERAPLEMVNSAWKKLVLGKDKKIDRRFYTFCVLERLQDALSRREVYVTPSERWGDPRAKLLRGQAWESARLQVCRTLDLSPTAEPELAELAKQIDEAYRRVNDNLPANPALHIEQVKGKDHVSLTGLDKLDEPDSLIELNDRVHALLPRVDITDALLEMHAYTGFADDFTHISNSDARVDDLALSNLCGIDRRGFQHRARTDSPFRYSGTDTGPAGMGSTELHSCGNLDPCQCAARRCAIQNSPGASFRRRRSRFRRRSALRCSSADLERGPQQ